MNFKNKKLFAFKVHTRAIKYYLVFRLAIPDLKVRTYFILSRLPVTLAGPLDLHALSTSPAFILS
jgi:hypothetical protein